MLKSNFSEIFLCKEPCSGAEGVLQERWNRIPPGSVIRAESGEKIEILSRGIWNMERGPDFRNAKILVNGKPVQGDIEIHQCSSDWRAHRHGSDPEYGNVILHVVRTVDGHGPEGVPVIRIPTEKKIQAVPEFKSGRLGECAAIYETMPPENLRNFFQDAGISRLRERAELLLTQMLRFGAEKVFLSRLFEYSGGKNNRKNFQQIFVNLCEKYPEETLKAHFEALLWGESGLLPLEPSALPPENADEAARLWAEWWPLRYDSGSVIHWERSAARPSGTPERRIAALAEHVRKLPPKPMEHFFSLFRSSASAELCAEMLVKILSVPGPDFWRKHASFTAAGTTREISLCASSRAQELVIDVVLPCVNAFALLRKNFAVAEKTVEVLKELPPPEINSVLRKASEKWFHDPAAALKILNNAAARQGVHCIWNGYCVPAASVCRECLIRNSFFE